MTSICRGWGNTRKASLKAIYNFMRYKFTREVKDPDDPDKMIWKEVFPVTIPKRMEFKVEPGTGSDYFKVMYVTHEDAVTGTYENEDGITTNNEAGVMLEKKENWFAFFSCEIGYGEASYSVVNSTCVDQGNALKIDDGTIEYRYLNDGKLDINTEDSFEVSLYDFHALEMVGNMYDTFLGCAVRIICKNSIVIDVGQNLTSLLHRIKFGVNSENSL